jgi:hypothetical protein
MHTWRVAIFGMVLTGLLLGSSRGSEEPRALGPENRRGQTNLAPNMQERWKAINEIAALITAGNFTRASELARHALPLPKDLTSKDLEALAEDFDTRVQAFRHILEGRDPLQSLQAWNAVFQGCVGCHTERGIKGQKLQE